MPMICTICRHPQRYAIDQAIASRMSYRRIAALYGVGYRSVGRHFDGCLKPIIREILREQRQGKVEQG